MIAGFEFGCRAPLHVRHERIESPASTTPSWRLLYASDLHLTEKREHIGAQLVDLAARERFDAVLLGGDLLDRREGAVVLAKTVKRIVEHTPVAAVTGNHDGWFGSELSRNAVRAGGGHWLHDFEVELARDGARLQLSAEVRPRRAGDEAKVRVLVGHYPNIVKKAAEHYDVVLAGHLHGGQCVWWQHGTRLYPGAFFTRWNGLRFVVGKCVMLVSRGAADTLAVRFRCPREVISCEIGGEA